MPKSTALKKPIAVVSGSESVHETAFIRAYYDYKIGKPQGRTVLTAGLEPHFYDPRLDGITPSITNRSFGAIEKYHKTLTRELSFFVQVVKDQEKSTFDNELLVHLNGWLGALYAGITLAAPDELNLKSDEDFESYCWHKLAKSIFLEQERYCWQLVGISVDSTSEAKADQYMSVDELRDELQNHLPNFLNWLTAYLSKHRSLVDCLNGAVSGRRFYWEIGCEYLKQFTNQDGSPIKSVSECFPGIAIDCSDETKIQINTDAPDPIVRLHRLLYRPNSQELLRDCKSVLEDAADVEVKLKVADWLRPYTKYAFAQLGLSFMTKTVEHHRIKLELDHFLLNFVVFALKVDQTPSIPQTLAALKEFLKFKKDHPGFVQYFDRKGHRTKKSAESFYEKMNTEANFRLEDNLQDIQSKASTLKLLGKNADTPRKMMIISVGRPGSKRGNATTVVPLIQNIVAQGIGVEVCVGAYCYTEGRDANKVNEEISLVCHVETSKQSQYIEAMANFFHQEIYILVDENQFAYSIDLRDGKKREKGTWLETQSVNKNDLRPGDGYSLIGGKFFQTRVFSSETPLIQTNDFGQVTTRFGSFPLTPKQADVIRYMFTEYKVGRIELQGSSILDEVDSKQQQLQHIFATKANEDRKPVSAWGALIVSSKHGYYKLKL